MPEKRKCEVNSCNNADVKNQKEEVWSLLCLALKKSYGIDASQISFKKTANGKWISDKCCFSLSHSNNILVAAVSKTPVGVDVEKIDGKRMTERLAKRILTDKESNIFFNTAKEKRTQLLADAWTTKESIFKLKGEKDFCPNLIPAIKIKKRLFKFKTGSNKSNAKILKQKSFSLKNLQNIVKVKTINVSAKDKVFSLSVATQQNKSIIYRFLGNTYYAKKRYR